MRKITSKDDTKRQKDDRKKQHAFFAEHLRRCYGDQGIYAGLHQYQEYWNRDSMWASLGALALGDYVVVKKNLSLFFEQERDGLLPIRIGRKHVLLAFAAASMRALEKFPNKVSTHEMSPYKKTAHQKKPKHQMLPQYADGKMNPFCSDALTLPLIILCLYTKKTEDYSLFDTYITSGRIERMFAALARHTRNGLIYESAFSTWMDSTKKEGIIFYSNVLYYAASKLCYDLSESRSMKLKKQFLTEKSAEKSAVMLMIAFAKQTSVLSKNVLENMQHMFWNESKGFFVDWVGNNDQKYFDTFANLFAVYFDVATTSQKKRIFTYIEKNALVNAHGLIRKSHPRYAKRYVRTSLRAIGMSSYVLDIYYPWMSFFYFLSIKNMRRAHIKNVKIYANVYSEVTRAMHVLIERMMHDGTVYEAYDVNFSPFRTLFYRAEHPFAWACSFGVLLMDDTHK